jgi:hypothetical protein
MKFFALLILTCTLASAQIDSQKLLIQVAEQAMASWKSIPEVDRAAVLANTSELLKKHVSFRPDGTASADCIFNGKQGVEWKDLKLGAIRAQALTEADRLNGITKRYFVSMSAVAHRTWDPKTSAWSQWKPRGHVLFPSGFTVEFKGGKWIAIETDPMKYFTPSSGTPTPAVQRGTKDPQLPPGMTRAK